MLTSRKYVDFKLNGYDIGHIVSSIIFIKNCIKLINYLELNHI